MTVKEQIKAEIEQLGNEDLYEIYQLIRNKLILHDQSLEDTQPPPSSGSGLCGIWQDDRSAKNIVADILDSRHQGKEINL